MFFFCSVPDAHFADYEDGIGGDLFWSGYSTSFFNRQKRKLLRSVFQKYLHKKSDSDETNWILEKLRRKWKFHICVGNFASSLLFKIIDVGKFWNRLRSRLGRNLISKLRLSARKKTRGGEPPHAESAKGARAAPRRKRNRNGRSPETKTKKLGAPFAQSNKNSEGKKGGSLFPLRDRGQSVLFNLN